MYQDGVPGKHVVLRPPVQIACMENPVGGAGSSKSIWISCIIFPDWVTVNMGCKEQMANYCLLRDEYLWPIEEAISRLRCSCVIIGRQANPLQ